MAILRHCKRQRRLTTALQDKGQGKLGKKQTIALDPEAVRLLGRFIGSLERFCGLLVADWVRCSVCSRKPPEGGLAGRASQGMLVTKCES
jgi:hypothetical protein